MRILRGLRSQALPCGCLVGIYETYKNQTVAVIDAKGTACTDRAHRVDASVAYQAADSTDGRELAERYSQPPSTMPIRSR